MKSLRKVLAAILVVLCLCSLILPTYATDISITFTLDGVSTELYDKVITDTIKVGQDKSIVCSKIYLKTVQPTDEVTITNGHGKKIGKSAYFFLKANGNANWTTSQLTKKVSDFPSDFIVSASDLWKSGFSKESISDSNATYYFLCVNPNKLPFTDVRESDWFYEDVAFAYENGLFAGTSDTTFSPNASMTRAMLVTVLYRLEDQPAVNGRSGFSDVQYNGYYEDAVTWAADNGIVNGTSTTTFSPNANVTREQMAAILYRYAQYKKYNTAASSGLNGFTDHASVSGYAAASLEWAVAEKLVNGSNGKLMPTGNATRAQVAAILHRFVENVATTK